ncbi:MAG TPA: tetratricopeptide repeat protein [Casimicrobiaceae bacterium]|nr:tetratricopeptide repeat protein [Casimicrobiaceae bacterium]
MSLESEFQHAFRVHQQGKLREAFLRYDSILKAEPDHVPSLHYSGVVLFQAGKLPEAAERIRAALQLDPSIADAWSNLAMVLEAAGRHEAAINALREAAQRAPRSTAIWNNLAASEIALGWVRDGEASARKAIEMDGTHAAAWYNLALALSPQGRTLEALDAASRAASMAPAQPTYVGLKAQLEDTAGLVQKARTTLEQALIRHPTSVALRFEWASLLERSNDRQGAATAYAQVLAIEPTHGPALSSLLFLRHELAQWSDVVELQRRFRAGVATGTPMLSPFVLLSQPSTRAEQRRCAETWTAATAGRIADQPRTLLSAGRLRIGYLSADFHTHATAFLTAGLFEHHDRGRFEVFAYSTGPDDASPMRKRLMRAFDRFVDAAGWPARRVAEAIRADGIDLLVDLKGHTESAPVDVLALRAAPIQVHYLGYPGTLGGAVVDYLVGDPIVTPLAHAADYAETLALLPHSYQVNDIERAIGEVAPRAALDLPDRGPILCCFNRTYKLNPAVFDAWARILGQLPDAVLWLLARDERDPVIANLRAEARQRGIDPVRVVFATHRSQEEYLALYRHADLFLDTWPYNAHTTASDALWAGCPVVTWLGETFAGRVAASLLNATGLPQLVANDVDDYVDKAVLLGRDAGELARLRNHLEMSARESKLFDTARTTRALERAYLAMADQYRRGVREPIVVRE